MARTIINTPIGKSLFERLLINKSGNREIIYFDKTTTENGNTQNKIFDIDPTIFYKPFEIEINYDITNQAQPKNTIAFFCCRNNSESGYPSIHIFAINKELNIDMSNKGAGDRKNTRLTLNDKGKINIKYNNGIINFYYNDVPKNTYDISTNKLTTGLSNKCSVGQSYTTNLRTMANGVNGTVNVKIKELQ